MGGDSSISNQISVGAWHAASPRTPKGVRRRTVPTRTGFKVMEEGQRASSSVEKAIQADTDTRNNFVFSADRHKLRSRDWGGATAFVKDESKGYRKASASAADPYEHSCW